MQLKTINWDKQYEQDMKEGKGVDLKVANAITKDGVRHPNGIYSPFFGSTSGDSIEFIERYSCDCKKLKGKFNNGIMCKECGTEVVYRKIDVSKTGWITINENYSLIHPIFFRMIKKIIGRSLDSILQYDAKIDRDGVVEEVNSDKNPFYSIGIVEFKERFDEILNYYYDLNKSKKDITETYNFIKEHREDIFVNHIPIFSLILRDITIIKDNVMSEPINRKINLLLGTILSLNKSKNSIDKDPLRVLPMLASAQTILMELVDMIFDLVGGKDGHIRSNLLGNRVNFSSRCVIVPLIGNYKINEVVLPYSVVMSFYKFEIINLITKLDKCSLSEALDKWNRGSEKFDRRMYLIMKHLIDNTPGGLRVLINRNPSLALGSILQMRIVDVKEDYNDLTMSIPVNILGVLAGDFDGSTINYNL